MGEPDCSNTVEDSIETDSKTLIKPGAKSQSICQDDVILKNSGHTEADSQNSSLTDTNSDKACHAGANLFVSESSSTTLNKMQCLDQTEPVSGINTEGLRASVDTDPSAHGDSEFPTELCGAIAPKEIVEGLARKSASKNCCDERETNQSYKAPISKCHNADEDATRYSVFKSKASGVTVGSAIMTCHPKLRRRRCRSLSKAENIVTEEEKIRRSQPDKPIHKPRDSLFSWSSGFQNFEGVINWAFLLLTVGGFRLGLENLNKYGILVDPTKWFFFGLGASESGFNNYPTIFMILYSNVPVISALWFEKLMFGGWISRSVGLTLHILNLTSILIFPVYVINSKFEYMGPGMEGVFLVVTLGYVILFLKLYSYIHTMNWLRVDYFRQKNNKKLKRERSVQHYTPSNAFASFSLDSKTLKENGAKTPDENLNTLSHLHNNTVSSHHKAGFNRKVFDTIPESTPRHQNFETNLITPPSERIRSTTLCGTSVPALVQYPDNLNLKDVYYFWCAPTLCYELNFPRSSRIRKFFLLRRALEVLVGSNLFLALIQQWIIPSVVNSLLPFSNMKWSHATERLLKLAIPNHLIWLTMFYLVFHSFLNTVGEILQFADRNFYGDWWNAKNLMEFWKTWNLPVHEWCVRHMYKPLVVEMKITRFQAMLCVFMMSAILHEYLVSVPLRMFKAYAFFGMVLQIPLIYLSAYMHNKWSPRCGNLLVWLSVIIGQPLAVMMYYHDFVVVHYGKELLQTFGKLN